jgi:hypothetical protein
MTDQFKPYVIENFLSTEEVETILSCAKELTEEQWKAPHQDMHWAGRSCSLDALKLINRPAMQLIGKEIFPRARQALLEHYSPELPIYPDSFTLCRWPIDSAQIPHWDNMKGLGEEKEKNNQHRVFGIVIYLNDDYTGGQTYYPKFNHYVKPKSGMLAMHPADELHEHGVTKIEGTTRYTLASFWTYIPSFTQSYCQDDYFLKTSKTSV